ncbi:MAG: hypothetical protein KAT34_18475 [Candidatus Aminicenantes bacterium]|nr:hypothetical protein [Candidatus Aminicenantes bacterium]
MIYMEIGGVQFSVFSRSPHLLQKHEAVYRRFIRKTKNMAAAIDVTIHLEAGDLPETGNLSEIFDSGQSWSMFREGDVYWIVRQPRAFSEPLWVARFGRDMAEVTVYCSDKITSTPFRYPLDQVLLMYILARNNGAIVHAAGLRIGNKGLLFPGPSGAGKSTLLRQFAGCKESEVSLLSDDRIIIRKIDGDFHAFGTPWPGEEGIALNEGMSLSGIFFLSHGEQNSLKELNQPEVLEKLLRVTSIPWYDRDVMDDVLHFCEDLITKKPCYELLFTPDSSITNFLKTLPL